MIELMIITACATITILSLIVNIIATFYGETIRNHFSSK